MLVKLFLVLLVLISSSSLAQETSRQCVDGVLNPAIPLELVFLLDQCPVTLSSSQCQSMIRFGKSVQRMLRDDFGWQANTTFLASGNCSCANFTSIVDDFTEISTFPVYNPKAITFGVSIHLSSSSQHYSRFARTVLDHLSGNIPSFVLQKLMAMTDIFVCNGSTSCPDAATATLKSIDEIQEVNPLVVIRQLACGKWDNTVPIVSLHTGEELTCICQCSAGYKWESDYCVSQEPTVQKCPWESEKCYEIGLQQLGVRRSDTECRIDLSQHIPVPLPGDNYVYNHTNAYDLNTSVNGVQVGKYVDTGTPLQPYINVQVSQGNNSSLLNKYYNWRYYTVNSKTIYQNINYTWTPDSTTSLSTGTFAFNISAVDYANPKAVCSTIVIIVDDIRPLQNNQACPKNTKSVFLDTTNSTQSRLQVARTSIAEFFNWVGSRQNDPCGYQSRACDVNSYQESFFCDKAFGEPCASRALSAVPDTATSLTLESIIVRDYFKLHDNDVKFMKTHLQTHLQTQTAPGDATYCTKVITLHHTFKERVDGSRCHLSSEPLCMQSKDLKNSDCQVQSQVVYPGNTLFTIEPIELTTETARQSTAILATLTNPEYANPATSIHYYVHHKCTAIGGKGIDLNGNGKIEDKEALLCSITRDLQSLVRLEASFNPDALNAQIFPCAPGVSCVPATRIAELVQFRYQINGGRWREYSSTASSILTFVNDVNDLRIEAWSACGKIGQRAHFRIILHLHRQFELCPSFPRMFTQLEQRSLVNDRYCNTRESAFADLTFQFNPRGHVIPTQSHAAHANDGLPDFLQYQFREIQCRAKFMNSKAAALVLQEHNFQHPITREFAIVYPTQPTAKSTTITWECAFTYQAYNNTEDNKVNKETQRCSHVLVFHDCDQPHFETCPLRLRHAQAAPYKACNGHRIQWNGKPQSPTKYESFQSQDNFCAPTACGATACHYLVPGIPEGIKRCTRTSESSQSSLESTISLTEVAFKDVVVRDDLVFGLGKPTGIYQASFVIASSDIVWHRKLTTDAIDLEYPHFLHLDYDSGHLCFTAQHESDQKWAIFCTTNVFATRVEWTDYSDEIQVTGDVQIENAILIRLINIQHAHLGSRGHLISLGHPWKYSLVFSFINIAWDGTYLCGISYHKFALECAHSTNLDQVHHQLEFSPLASSALMFLDVEVYASRVIGLDRNHHLYFTEPLADLKWKGFKHEIPVHWTPVASSVAFSKFAYDGTHICGILVTTHQVKCFKLQFR